MITFDHNPIVYWVIAYLFAGLVIFLANKKNFPSTAWLTLAFLLYFVFRLPVIVFNREINADESQMISHAITLFQDPVYWRSADGTTIGPLSIYPLIFPRIFGFAMEYTSARLVGVLINIGTFYFFYKACKEWFGQRTARFSMLTALLFLALTQEADFVHYSSEQVALFLLALCLMYVASMSRSKNFLPSCFLLGFFAGMIPFAKLQAVPQALIMVAGGLWILFMQRENTNRTLSGGTLLVTGGLTFPVVVLFWTLLTGVFSDLVDFYILGNAIYAGENNAGAIPVVFWNLLRESTDFQAFMLLVSLSILSVFLVKSKAKQTEKLNRFLWLFLSAYLLGGIYAATKSGNLFVHYLNFCVFPLVLLFALSINRFKSFRWSWPVLILFSFLIQDFFEWQQQGQLNRYDSTGSRRLAESPVVTELKKYTRTGDHMVVWGWQCRYYVEAQLAHGTAENHSERCIYDHPMRDQYRKRYLRDMMRNQPAFFIDAVGKNSLWVQDTAQQSYRSFPELATYIDQNYKSAGTIDGDRLFIRNNIYETP